MSTPTTTTTTPKGPPPGYAGAGGPQSGSAAPGSASNQPLTPEQSQQYFNESGAIDPSYSVYINRGVHDKEMGSHYSSGANYQTVQTQMAWFYSLRGDALTHLQDQLEAAGLLPSHSLHPGSYGRGIAGDEDTAKAYKMLLSRAIATGQTIDESLADASGAFSQMGPEGPTKQPFVFNPTNPADIRHGVKSIAHDVLGRGLSKEELATFVSLYQGLERNYAQQQYDMNGSGLPGGSGGTNPQAPSLGAFAEEEIRKLHPNEAKAHDIALVGQRFFDMLGGG